KHHELIDGKAVEMTPPGGNHGNDAVTIAALLHLFVRAHALGSVFVETGFVLKRNPDLLRSPDVSFVATAQLPGGKIPRGYIEGAPTIAVEINSPNDVWHEVEDKVQAYLEAGSREVWIVDADSQTITVRTVDAPSRVYRRDETLTGSEVLPGFTMPLSEIFED
ncbi:MAG TPA: Uma2 family endonuclease, partial [Abditibacteriaceae bacterium]